MVARIDLSREEYEALAIRLRKISDLKRNPAQHTDTRSEGSDSNDEPESAAVLAGADIRKQEHTVRPRSARHQGKEVK